MIDFDVELTLHNVSWADFDGDDYFINFDKSSIGDLSYLSALYHGGLHPSSDGNYHTLLDSPTNSFKIIGVDLVNKEELQNFNSSKSSDLKLVLKSRKVGED